MSTTKEKKTIEYMKFFRNIVIVFGILCIMMGIYDFESYAATSFKKTKPIGVMSTSVSGTVVLTWEPVKNADGYRVYEALPKKRYHLVGQSKNSKMLLKGREQGMTYRYYIKAYKNRASGKKTYSKASNKVSVHVPKEGVSTVKNFLQTAIAPIGSTMYVWGGGWNKADTAAGREAKRTGLSASWRTFAQGKTEAYDYNNYRYRIHDGLDCSGYVGWCVYNIMNQSNNQEGYVYSASKQAKKFSNMGFGAYRTVSEIQDYKAGDIMSSTCSCCGHVWIVIGECEDGSVVLVHASPPGVQLSGTPTPEGTKNSQAYRLAKKYMKKYYKAWYKRYPNVSKGSSYLSHYGQMRWDTTGEEVILSDPEGYQTMSANEVLKDLFKRVK